jgi:hypothetical protein
VLNRVDGTYMWGAGSKNQGERDTWILSVDNEGNILHYDSDSDPTENDYLFTRLKSDIGLNRLSFPSSSVTSYQRTILGKNNGWRLELNDQGFQLINKDKRVITLYKRTNNTTNLDLILNQNGLLQLTDGGNVVWKTGNVSSSTNLTFNAVIDQTNASIDIFQGQNKLYSTFVSELTSSEYLSSSGEYKAIISDNKNYLLSIDNIGLFILNIELITVVLSRDIPII